MKKFLTVVLIILLLSQTVTVMAEGESENITSGMTEISFVIGEDVVNINGNLIHVVAPYAVDGTTLVPLRVISEAFGAEVFWDGATRQVTINFKDVTILLTIDSKDVYINGQKQELLLAPQAANGSTMVPLRFISEAFDANVEWIKETNSVLVTLDLSEGAGLIDDITTVLKDPVKPQIGDSYYKWSMNLPDSYVLVDQDFDAGFLCFDSTDEKAYIYVIINENVNNWTIDNIKSNESKMAEGFTLIDQYTGTTGSGVKYICTQMKDKEYFIDSKVTIKDSYIFMFDTYIEASVPNSERAKYIEPTSSFDFTFNAESAEDVSNVQGDFRFFENNYFGVSCKIPLGYYDSSDTNVENKFGFVRYDKNGIMVGKINLNIYSIEAGRELKEWAQYDYNYNKTITNPDIFNYSAITNTNIAGQQGVSYTITARVNRINYITQDIYFYYEGYAYNFSIDYRKDDEKIAEQVIHSLKINKIDAEEVGKLSAPIREVKTAKSPYESKAGKFKMTVPVSWVYVEEDQAFYDYDTTMTMFVFNSITLGEQVTSEGVKESVKSLEDQGFVIVSSELSKKVPNEIEQYILKLNDNNRNVYYQINAFKVGSVSYFVVSVIQDVSFSPFFQSTVYDALNSIENLK